MVPPASSGVCSGEDALSRHEVPGGGDPGHARVILDWLAERGAAFDSVLLTFESGTERGVRARRDIEAGERVVSIPRSCLLMVERGAHRDAASLHSHLAASLIQERDDPRSAWRAYLGGLPTSFPSVPLFYGEDDLALLRGSYLLDKIARRRASLQDDFALLRSAGGLAGASLDAFVWARFIVCSRVFGIFVAGEPTLALVPLADMLNHPDPPDVRWSYEDEEGAFVMTAMRDIRAFEPVCDSYGRKCNGRFLLSYGFVLDDNPDNTAEVRLAVPRSEPAFEARVRLLGDVSRAFLVSPQFGSAGTREALAFLRVAHASEAELRAASGQRLRGLPLGARGEARALAALAAACSKALGRFPTTVEDDEARIQGGTLGPIARRCVVMRRGEKQVLLRVRAAAERGGDGVGATRPAAAREAPGREEARAARLDALVEADAW